MATSPDDFFSIIASGPPLAAHNPIHPTVAATGLSWDSAPQATTSEFYANYHPTLWDLVDYARNYYNEESGRYEPLIGETEALCTAWVAYVAAELGVIIRSYPGTGKTATANPIFDTIPKHKRHRILNLSGKGIWSDTEDIVRSSYVYLGEWQKAAQNEDVVEVVKDWGEGRAAERRRTDVTERTENGGFGIHITKLPRKPILVTVASADGKDDQSLNEQVLRRYPEVATDPSQSQTAAVIDMKGSLWDPGTEGVLTMTEDDKNTLREHVRIMIDTAPKETILPGGRFVLGKTVPTDYPISRSMSDIFKKIVNGITRFHHYDRLTWSDKEGKPNLVATPSDVWMARRIYGNVLFLNCLRVSTIGKEILDAMPKLTSTNVHGQLVATAKEKLTAAEVRKALKARGISLEKAKVSHELAQLEFNTYVEMDKNDNPIRYWRSESTTNFDQHLSPEMMREIVEEVKARAAVYPFAAEYVRRFCTGPIMVRDPLTGEMLDILSDEPPVVTRVAPEVTMESQPEPVGKVTPQRAVPVPAASSKGNGLYAFG